MTTEGSSSTRTGPHPPGLDEATRARVVITGVGIVSPIGRSLTEAWDAIASGRSGVRPISRFDASRCDTRIAGEVADADALDTRFSGPYWAGLTRRSRFAVSAALSAVQGASLSFTQENRGWVATVIASDRPDEEELLASARLLDDDPEAARTARGRLALPHAPADRVASMLGVTGPTLQLGSGAGGGLAAIIEAAAIIRRGDALVAVAGGAEAPITPLGLGAFDAVGALSRRNDDPAAASRPLDAGRDGFVLAEGAAVVTLEALEVATARGAKILAELEGEGMTFSAGAGGEPSLDAAQVGAALQRALATSGRIQSEVDLIALHAAGSIEGDRAEATGVKRIFGAAARHHLYTPALASHTGHLLAAAGPLALAILLEAMHRQVVPWTRNLDAEDPAIDLDANPGGLRADALRVAMVNACGPGQNAAIAICHPEAMRPIAAPGAAR